MDTAGGSVGHHATLLLLDGVSGRQTFFDPSCYTRDVAPEPVMMHMHTSPLWSHDWTVSTVDCEDKTRGWIDLY